MSLVLSPKMRNPKFIPDQKLFYRHVVADDKLYISRVIEYLATTVKSSRYDKKTDTFYYKITHPSHQDILVEVPEYDLFNTYKDAVCHDKFLQ